MTVSSQLDNYYLELAKSPVCAENFAGTDARYSEPYERLEQELGKAASLHSASGVDWQRVCEGSEALLAQHSKDLRVAAWLIWALFQRQSFPGLQAGLGLLCWLCSEQWDELYPRKPRTRAAAVGWLVPRLERVIADDVPVAGQLPVFTRIAEQLRSLDQLFSARLGDEAPLLLPLCRRLEAALARAGTPASGEPGAVETVVSQVRQLTTQLLGSERPATIESDRDAQKLLRQLQELARPLSGHWLRQKATDVRALRLSRTLLWLPIDTLPQANAERITALRGIPADRLAAFQECRAQGRHADLLLELETSLMRAPFWLDGQRLAWECLQALGAEQGMQEVEFHLALLLQRLPGLDNLRFHDGSPFADGETRAWLATRVLPRLQPAAAPCPPASEGELPAWEKGFGAAFELLASEGLRQAVRPLALGITRSSGRERFFWQLAQARLCMAAKQYELAKTQLEALDAQLQSSGLADWEPDLTLQLLRLLRQCCEALPQNHTVRESKDAIHRRLCHLALEAVLD